MSGRAVGNHLLARPKVYCRLARQLCFRPRGSLAADTRPRAPGKPLAAGRPVDLWPMSNQEHTKAKLIDSASGAA